MHRQVDRLLHPPPTSQDSSSIHLPHSLSAHPPPLSTSFPTSLRLPHPLSLDRPTGDTNGILTQTKLSRTGLERPGEFQGKAFRTRPTAERSVSAFLEDG